MKHTKIRANYACRKCLNRKYGLHLEQEDCLYHLYPNKCRQCGEICNIVADVRWTRQWKLWLSKEAEATYDRSIEALARDAGVIK